MTALRVTVCLLTYRRPDDLAAALPAVLDQATALAGVSALDAVADVLVVDNDPDAGARRQVQQQPGVRYAHEPEPGIAAARNRALAEAADSDLLVFLDDDERPTDGWLAALVDTWRASRPAGVVGPVVSRFDGPLDPWIAAGGFFTRRRLPTGTEVGIAATNNLLLDLAQVRERGLRFDLRLGLTGGSDTMFTAQLTRSGGRLVWCDEALVLDVVPADRCTRAWVLQRAYRTGNSSSLVQVLLADAGRERLRRRAATTGQGLARVGGGLLRGAAGAVTGSSAQRANGARNLARGRGMVAGALGRVYAEYQRPDTERADRVLTPCDINDTKEVGERA